MLMDIEYICRFTLFQFLDTNLVEDRSLLMPSNINAQPWEPYHVQPERQSKRKHSEEQVQNTHGIVIL